MYGLSSVLALLLVTVQAVLTLLLGMYLGRRGESKARQKDEESAGQSRQVLAIATQLRQLSSDVLAGVRQLNTRVEAFDEHIQTIDPRSDLSQIQKVLATEVSQMVQGNQSLQKELGAARQKIEEQSKELSDYRRQSRTDQLTGAMNRRGLDEELVYLLSLTRRYGDKFGALMIDLDNFKQVNDVHGHTAGDKLLRGVAQTLIRLMRDTDIVARYGGDEFVVLLPHCDLTSVGVSAERARQAVQAAAFNCNDLELVGVTISVGATAVLLDDTVESLIGRADAAMMRAKAVGRPHIHDGDTITKVGEDLVTLEGAALDEEREANARAGATAEAG